MKSIVPGPTDTVSTPAGTTGVPSAAPAKRRGLLFGAGLAGIAAIAAKTLPVAPAEVTALPGAKALPVTDEGGYQLTQHVLRYYETTKV
jgi:hypothetical protein